MNPEAHNIRNKIGEGPGAWSIGGEFPRGATRGGLSAATPTLHLSSQQKPQRPVARDPQDSAEIETETAILVGKNFCVDKDVLNGPIFKHATKPLSKPARDTSKYTALRRGWPTYNPPVKVGASQSIRFSGSAPDKVASLIKGNLQN